MTRLIENQKEFEAIYPYNRKPGKNEYPLLYPCVVEIVPGDSFIPFVWPNITLIPDGCDPVSFFEGYRAKAGP